MIAVIEQEPTTALSLAAICRALQVNRAAYYRAHQQATSRDDIELRDAIQRIALEMPGYGSRRITAELRRRGWTINRKRVQRFMREDNLLCLRRVQRVRTTDSRHGLTVYSNLVPELQLTGLNQLWVADITYIRLLREFVYLAVLLDGYSRRCIGWSLGRTLGDGAGRWKLCGWPWRSATWGLHWCIIPIAACNTRPETTRRCWPSTASPSA